MSHYYHFSEFSGVDTITRLKAAMAALREDEGSTLLIEPGTYLLTTELARQAVENVMSGAWSDYPQDIMFRPSYQYSIGMDLSGHKGTTILAKDVTFLVDGFMEPISIRDSEDVTVVGLTVDHKKKPFSVGTFSPPTDGDDGRRSYDVILDAPITEGTPIGLRNLVYNEVTSRLEDLTVDLLKMERIDSRTVRISGINFGFDYTGMRFYFWHTYHSRPVILIQRSKNVTVKDVTVHSSPGMGITCDHSANVLLEGYRNVPAEGYHVSTNTDATHFTSCTGKITVRGCTFIGQGDDSLNIHGYYHTVLEQDGCRCLVKNEFPDGISHSQSPDYPDIGDTLEINDPETLTLLGTRKVVGYKIDEKDGSLIELILDEPLPPDAAARRLFLCDVDHMAALEFAGNDCRGHFANGLRIRTRNVHIHDNLFEDIMECALIVYAEIYCREGANPANVVIENNVMRRCGHLGRDLVAVRVGLPCHGEPSTTCIQNVVIRHNVFDRPDGDLEIEAIGVDGLTVKDNTFLSPANPLRLCGCTNVLTDV